MLDDIPVGTVLLVHQLWSDDNRAGVEILKGEPMIALHEGVSDLCADLMWLPEDGREPPVLTRIDDNDEFEVVPHDQVEDWVWVEIAKRRLLDGNA